MFTVLVSICSDWTMVGQVGGDHGQGKKGDPFRGTPVLWSVQRAAGLPEVSAVFYNGV